MNDLLKALLVKKEYCEGYKVPFTVMVNFLLMRKYALVDVSPKILYGVDNDTSDLDQNKDEVIGLLRLNPLIMALLERIFKTEFKERKFVMSICCNREVIENLRKNNIECYFLFEKLKRKCQVIVPKNKLARLKLAGIFDEN